MMDIAAFEQKPRTILAILTMPDEEKQFRGNRQNFVDLIRAGKEKGILVYLITPLTLKLTHKRVLGFVFDFNKNDWQAQMMPFPNVIYNRIPLRSDETIPEVQKILQDCLNHKQVQLFNPYFFNKWTLVEWLGQARKTRRYLPVTRKLSTSQDLGSLLKDYSSLYLKPDRGKAGKGIMKIQIVRSDARTRNEYWLTIQKERSSQLIKFANLSGVWNSIKQQIDDEDYIVQQGIPLSSYKKRPFDLRVLVQKNAKGKWDLTGIGARLAGKLSITTHVPRGGSIDDPEKLLAAAFDPRAAKRMLLRVKKAALKIAGQIEKKSGHSLGEMSQDLGIDTSGNIWFFEANAKPMKFDEPHIRKKSLDRIIQYSIYLSKKSSIKRGD